VLHVERRNTVVGSEFDIVDDHGTGDDHHHFKGV
jgi:hypothetical protein